MLSFPDRVWIQSPDGWYSVPHTLADLKRRNHLRLLLGKEITREEHDALEYGNLREKESGN